MIKVGIFFGGMSREREISFAGGRTVYDNLDKSIFQPIPIFVDSVGHFIHLKWEFLYKGTIRDFYPSENSAVVRALVPEASPFQRYVESLGELNAEQWAELISHVGEEIQPKQFPQFMDVAFLCLHGPFGEDGTLQGMLEWYGVPYTGSGILSSAIGLDKVIQRGLMEQAGFRRPAGRTLSKKEWLSKYAKEPKGLFEDLLHHYRLPFVVKSPSQGSSIGVSIVRTTNVEQFQQAVEKSLFLTRINRSEWTAMNEYQQFNWIRKLIDIREGIGLPVLIHTQREEDLQPIKITSPEALHEFLNGDNWGTEPTAELLLESTQGEEQVLFEAFLNGKEFSCIVIEDQFGEPIALPPTEIIKASDVFDYRAKYLPGISRKVTPIDLPQEQIDAIRSECERLYLDLNFGVYARIDGFIDKEDNKVKIYLNDPNTTSGMLPSSFFFHQAAEIGLNPSQFLTYIIHTSLNVRLKTGRWLDRFRKTIDDLDAALAAQRHGVIERKRVAVLMGGYSTERHISVESGRNVYEKLSSSGAYEAFPVFVTGNDTSHQLYKLPINYMLKDNADDIKEKVLAYYKVHPVIEEIRERAEGITKRFAGEVLHKPTEITYPELARQADAVFIALHGRPGEDGQVQKRLEKVGLPYNGSGPTSSGITINKYETNEILRKAGFHVAGHTLLYKKDWLLNRDKKIQEIETAFPYPFIAKPSDDGCSSAVKKIKNREQLIAFTETMFRERLGFDPAHSAVLGLAPNEEFPQKEVYLIETLIEKGEAQHFLEVTGGMLTHMQADGSIRYEVFEPSETLASGEVLSLEEKFLAGEGQNITPARFSPDPAERNRISALVKETLGQVAKTLQVEGYCRIDAFVHIYADGSVKTSIIEINSLPGMTPATCIFHQSAINNYKPAEFIEAILKYGAKRTAKLAKA